MWGLALAFLILQIKARDGHRCCVCGWTPRTKGQRRYLHAHHVTPKSVNPRRAYDPCNLVTLCWRCHWDVSEPAHRRLLSMNAPEHGLKYAMNPDNMSDREVMRDMMAYIHAVSNGMPQ